MSKPKQLIFEPLDVLRFARSQIADPKQYTKGAGARNACGQSVHPTQAVATCWDVRGAVLVASSGVSGIAEIAEDAIAKVLKTIGEMDMTRWCTVASHEEALYVLDMAIGQVNESGPVLDRLRRAR